MLILHRERLDLYLLLLNKIQGMDIRKHRQTIKKTQKQSVRRRKFELRPSFSELSVIKPPLIHGALKLSP